MSKVVPFPQKAAPPEKDFVRQCLKSESLGHGSLFAELYRERFVFNTVYETWMEWNNLTWREDIFNQALASVEQVALLYAELLPEAEEALDEVLGDKNSSKGEIAAKSAVVKLITGQIRKLRNPPGRNAAMEFARTLEKGALVVDGHEFDKKPWLLATKTCVINLKTGKERPARQTDWLTQMAGVEWPEAGLQAKCPLWEKFLWDVFEDQEKIDFLQRWSGYLLTGDVSEQKFLQLAGDGRNGKGIYADVMQAIMGDLAGPIQSELLMDQGRNKNASGPTPELMSLYGRRLAIASESDENRRYSVAKVKWLSGADKIVAREPHAPKEFIFAPTHKLMLLTNNNPNAPADDLAFWERIILLEFPFMFMDTLEAPHHKKRNYSLRNQLEPELPAILAWAVRGCLEWCGGERRLDIPKVVMDATKKYQREEDVVQDWIDACLRIQDEHEMRPLVSLVSGLYNNFGEWFAANVGKKVPSGNWFGRRMKKKYPTRWHKDPNGNSAYRGIYVK